MKKPIISIHDTDAVLKSLKQSEKEIAEGKTVSIETILNKLKDSIKRMENKRKKS